MDLKHIARKLDNAAVKPQPIDQISYLHHFNLEEAYKIQHYLIKRRLDRGEVITGYKLGFTSKVKMQQMGVHDLIWGVLTNAMKIEPDSSINLSTYIHPRAEPEVAFRISKTINHQIKLEDIPNYIDKMAVAIEVIDSRYQNFKFSLADVIADNCSSIGYCIGEWKALKSDISDLNIQLQFNGQVIQEGVSKAILENPYLSVVELSRLASKDDIPLEKGQVILAGAATAAEWLKPETKVSAILEGYGDVSFEVK